MGLVFPGPEGGLWTKTTYDNWRKRAFDRACTAAKVEQATPYALRHSVASLLIHEGRSVMYVARQLGHDARLTDDLWARHGRARPRTPPGRGGCNSGGSPELVCTWCACPWRTRAGRLNAESPRSALLSGARADGARGTRTPDLLGAIQALSQLSYSPEASPKCSPPAEVCLPNANRASARRARKYSLRSAP